MPTMLRLDPPVPMKSPKGECKAFIYIDRGREEFGEWVCYQMETGEVWTWLDPQVRVWECLTDGRKNVSKIKWKG